MLERLNKRKNCVYFNKKELLFSMEKKTGMCRYCGKRRNFINIMIGDIIELNGIDYFVKNNTIVIIKTLEYNWLLVK